MLRRIYKFYRQHFYAINGALIGLVIGFSFVKLGILQTLFIALCVIAGFLLGKQLQKDKMFLKNLLDKILPPGSYPAARFYPEDFSGTFCPSAAASQAKNQRSHKGR